MNRIGWFVVCLMVASSIQSSLGDGRLAENGEDLRNNTKLKPVPETSESDVVEFRNVFDDFFGRKKEIQGQINEQRTFGHKRVQFMMLAPMMYKMGVMSTMVAVLTAISLKGLLIGLIILVLKLSSFIAKLQRGWHDQGHGQVLSPQPQPVHVHVHGDGHHSHNQAYSAWPSGGATIGEEEQHYYYKG